MIGISKLYLGQVESSDALRYNRLSAQLPSHLLQFAIDKKPVVVWNVTSRCNLTCRHCYASPGNVGASATAELSTAEGRQLIDDLATFGVPVILFSGGEPLLRPDLPELAEYAAGCGLRTVVSTNGTRITPELARRLSQIGLSYVGISLDGLRTTHDRLRGQAGAFDQALTAVRICRDAGLKVGLRVTVFQDNVADVPGVFDLLEQEKIPRICFYHLVYSGRGATLVQQDLDHRQTRQLLDTIIDRTKLLYDHGLKTEVLTVDNHCDGPYLYLRMLREGNPRAADVLNLLRMNGGNSSGTGIGCVSWDGQVYPDQFWRNQVLGNVRERPFGEIWTDRSNPFLMQLKRKSAYVEGRCATCRFLDICGGNFRARAAAVTGNIWAPDPACYLTDQEISTGEAHI